MPREDSPENVDATFAKHASAIRHFEQQCNTGSAPSIEEILADNLSSDRDLLIELIHIELEYRLKRGENVLVESYLSRFPNLSTDDEFVLDLIDSEFRLKSRSDPAFSIESMIARFPRLGDAIRARLSSSKGSTAGVRSMVRDQAVPDRIAKFKVLEEIGRGSFGMVLKALDTELNRIVAIKMPRAGTLATKSEIDRFLREARSASQLNHPNIVNLLEVGHTDGLCYLVSEFIDGEPLNVAFGRRAFTPRQIVQLVAEMADAVQAAHTAGIIHRDLKPANIIVDHQGRPHVTDFGLAKMEGHESSMSIDGQVLGTPAYMSPEQASGATQLVDARTDIYSLGVMLYEMLSRELPFQGSPRMVLMQVLNDHPRSMRRLDERIPRDLDTVVLKCLAKEPGERYLTSGELAAELRRWLAGEPVLARPIGAVASAWRWSKRNPRIAGLGAVVAGLLIIISVGSTLAAIAIERQRASAEKLANEKTALALSESAAKELAEQRQREAESARENEKAARETSDAVANFMAEMLGRPNPEVDGRSITIADALPRSVEKLNKDFADRPAIRAKLLDTVGWTYAKLGLYKDAVEVLTSSFDIYEKEFGAKGKVAAGCLANLATAYRMSGNFKKAIELGERALAILNAAPDTRPEDTIPPQVNLASSLKLAGDLKRSTAMLEDCYEKYEKIIGPKDSRTLGCLADLASAYSAAGRLKEAKEAYEKARQAFLETVGPDDLDLLRVANNLGSVLNQLDLVSESIPLLEDTLDRRRRILGEMHSHTTSTVNNLAQAYNKSNQLDKAMQLFKANLEVRTKALGSKHIQTLKAMYNLGTSLFNGGKRDEGIKLIEEAIEIADASELGKNTDVITMRTGLAQLLASTKQTDKAYELSKRILEIQTESLSAEHPITMTTLHTLGMIQIDRKDYEDAIELHSKALELRTKKLGAEHQDTLLSMNGLARALGESGQFDRAEKIFMDALEIRKRKNKEDWRTFDLMSEIGKFYFTHNKYDVAEPFMRDGLLGMMERLKTVPEENRPTIESTRKKLTELYLKTGRPDEAAKFQK